MNRKRSSIQLSLFPFLAVLICTMGVLVALLLLVVKQADQTAKSQLQNEETEIRARSEKLQNNIAENHLRLEVITGGREEVKKLGIRQREIRSYLDSELERLRGDADDLSRDLKAFLETSADDELQELQQLRDRAAVELVQAEQEKQEWANRIPTQDSQNAKAAAVYSIVPIAAQSGTNRRPIYIECSARGIVLHPGGIRLTVKDFVRPLQAGNPLDSALLAYQEFWRKSSQNGDAAYPLMVVRPSGAQWYPLIRRAMDSWTDEFGYELIPEDWEVDFGKANPALSERVKRSIELSRARQQTLLKLGHAVPLSSPSTGGKSAADSPGQVSLVPSSSGGFQTISSGSRGEGGPGPSDRASLTGVPSDPLASLSAAYHQQRLGGSQESPNPLLPMGNSVPSLEAGESELDAGRSNASTTPMLAGAGNSGIGENQSRSSNGSNRSDSEATRRGSGGNAQSTDQAAPGGNMAMGNPQAQMPASSSPQESPMSASNPESNPREWNDQAIAHRKGAGWALPNRRRNVSAYHRPIPLEINSRSIVVKSGNWNRDEIEIPLSEYGVEASIDPLIDAVWKRVDSWGSLGFDGYWKPVLQVRVSPENRAQVERLSDLLDGSGLSFQKFEE